MRSLELMNKISGGHCLYSELALRPSGDDTEVYLAEPIYSFTKLAMQPISGPYDSPSLEESEQPVIGICLIVSLGDIDGSPPCKFG